jgi:hypothetical protein
MNPYVTSITAKQRQRDLISEAEMSRRAQAAAEVHDQSPSSGIALRLRQAIAGTWSLAAVNEPALPRLHDYPYTPSI